MLHLENLGIDRIGNPDAAALGNRFGVILVQHGAVDLLGLAAAEHPVRLDAFEHVLEHLLDEDGLEFLRDVPRLGLGRCQIGRVDDRGHARRAGPRQQECGGRGRMRVHSYITWISA